MVAGHADALRGLRAIWIDAGTSDEYYLDLGAEAFRAELEALGIGEPELRFELFDGTHGGHRRGATPRRSAGSRSASRPSRIWHASRYARTVAGTPIAMHAFTRSATFMTFRRESTSTPAGSETVRGRRVRGGGLAVGGGLGTLVIVALILLIGGNLGDVSAASAPRRCTEGPIGSQLINECETGADANERQDCRLLGAVQSLDAYWSEAFAGLR